MIRYPDGTTQQCRYDALGELISQTNRDNSVHTYQYDVLGRQTKDTVTTFAAGVDQTVVALGAAYDSQGNPTLLTSYGAGGSVVNQVQDVYDGLGNLVTQYQSHSGLVNTASTPAVQYQYMTAYAGAGNYSRLTGVTYPDGSQITYAYAGLNGLDASISRIRRSANRAKRWRLTATWACPRWSVRPCRSRTSPKRVSLDNFGSVQQITWTQGGTVQNDNTVSGGTSLVNVVYGHNAVGDILWRGDQQANSTGANWTRRIPRRHAPPHRLQRGHAEFRNAAALDPQPDGLLELVAGLAGQPLQPAAATLLQPTTAPMNPGRIPRPGTRSPLPSTAAGPWLSPMTHGAASSAPVRLPAARAVPTGLPPLRPIATMRWAGRSQPRIWRSAGTSGTQTYYVGSNPIEVRNLENTAPLMKYVWSPADGRMIVREAVAAQLSADMGLTTIQANAAGGMQRLYPLTDGLGSIVAVVAATMVVPTTRPTSCQGPSNMVQERYDYTCDGFPQALNADWTARTTGINNWWAPQDASTLGWNWLYRGQQWVQTQPDTDTWTSASQWRGLYVTASGQWFDPLHARTLPAQPVELRRPAEQPLQDEPVRTVPGRCAGDYRQRGHNRGGTA